MTPGRRPAAGPSRATSPSAASPARCRSTSSSRAAPTTRGATSRVGFPPSTEIDREAFGLTWNQALETGGVLVGKEVKIEIEAEADPPVRRTACPRRAQTCGRRVEKSTSNSQVVPLAIHKAGLL